MAVRPMAGLCDYGMGNLHSAAKALERAGFAVKLAAAPSDLSGDICVLPGVGHIRRCLEALASADLVGAVCDWVGDERPFLGICVGAQMLFEGSDEADVPGLGLLKGWVRRLDAPRIPHMGWNEAVPGPAADGLFTTTERYYFVHSYGLVPADGAVVAAACDYGGGFCAAVADGPVVATQFHPEKSGHAGLALLERVRARL